MMEKNVRCQIFCQRDKRIDTEIPAGTGWYEKDGICIEVTENVMDGCRCGRIRLNMKNKSCRENKNLRMENPIRLYIPMTERPQKITAMYLYNEWWTRPAFVESFSEIPEHTQVAFFQYKDRVSCMALMAGREFKTSMTGGTEDEICLEMSGGFRRCFNIWGGAAGMLFTEKSQRTRSARKQKNCLRKKFL